MLTKVPNSNGGFTTRLAIFENFKVDHNLPKNKPKTVTPGVTGIGGVVTISDSMFVTTSTNSTSVWTNNLVMRNSGENILPNSRETFAEKVSRLWKEFRRTSIEETFRKVANAAQQVSFTNKMNDVDEYINRAKKHGQTALAEQLKKNRDVMEVEMALVHSTFRTFITEEKLVQFVQESKRGIRLDWIENFTRLIPRDVLEKKEEADLLEVFDNYVVLHYDPNGRSTEMTEAEKARAKDPILFGVSRRSRRLYFIGDWKDELCDLTMEDIIQKFGKDALTL
jgi:hypothetical protein